MKKLNKISRTEMKNVMGGLMPAGDTLKFACQCNNHPGNYTSTAAAQKDGDNYCRGGATCDVKRPPLGIVN